MSKAQIEAVKKMKPSAYKSMQLSRLGLVKLTPEKEENLLRWKQERWQNLTGLLTDNKFLNCGTKGKKQQELGLPSICRPSVRINDKSPKPLVKDLTEKQIIKALKMKMEGKRISWKNL